MKGNEVETHRERSRVKSDSPNRKSRFEPVPSHKSAPLDQRLGSLKVHADPPSHEAMAGQGRGGG